MNEHGKMVHIKIDGKQFELPPVTTGAVLYTTGGVRPDYDLYREEKGPGDDVLIPNSGAEVRLHSGDHFYSAKRTLNPGA